VTETLANRPTTAIPLDFHESPHETDVDRERIHAWVCDLDDEWLTEGLNHSVLSDAEVSRSERCEDWRLCQRFLRSRVILRHLLGSWTGVPPDELYLERDPHGKPFLAFPANQGKPPLRTPKFNLSRADNLLLLGISPTAEIGVDVEVIRTDFDVAPLVEDYFSGLEARWLTALAASERPTAFFKCWTMKEAFLKASGLGPALGMHTVEIELDSSGAPWVARVAEELAPFRPDACCQRTLPCGQETAVVSVVSGRFSVTR